MLYLNQTCSMVLNHAAKNSIYCIGEECMEENITIMYQIIYQTVSFFPEVLCILDRLEGF